LRDSFTKLLKMGCLVKIFFCLWLLAGFHTIIRAQDRNKDSFEQNFVQANDLIGQTGDSLRMLIAEINESADLTDLQKAKIDLIRLKLNTLEDVLKMLSTADYLPLDTNRFSGTLINDARKLIVQSRPDEGIPLILKFLEDIDSQSDSAVFARIYLAEAYRQKQEHTKGIEIIYDILEQGLCIQQDGCFAK